MKNDIPPQRLIDSSDEWTRELLAGVSAEAPAPGRASAWVDAAVAASGPGALGSQAGELGLKAWHAGALAKGLASLVVLGLIGLGAAHWVGGAAAPPAPSVALAAAPAPTVDPAPAATSPEPPVIAVTDLPPSPVPAAGSARARSSPRPEASAPGDAPSLGPQLERVRAARALVQAGDAGGALRAVADYEQSFPRGAFWPEAEAIAIDALLAAGRTPEARERARQFIRLYGESPQASRFKSLAGM